MEEKRVQQEDEISLLDYLIVLLKHRRLIMTITFGSALIAVIISLLMPPVYKAETRILPPKTPGPSLGILSQLGGESDALVGGLLGIRSSSELYASLLKSNTVLDRIIDRFKLMELYDIDKRTDARNMLLKKINVSVEPKSGIIKLTVEDKDPKMAADMANAFVEELKNLTKGLAITEAAQRRLFLEEQLKNVKMELIKAEEDMKSFQEKTGAIKVEEQAKAVIESIANLRAQIAAKEVELRVMRTYLTPNNPDLRKAEEALRAMRAELRRLEEKGSSNPDPLIPTGKMPQVGVEYLRKLRDLKFNETLYELLLKAYEAAKLSEAQEPAVIQVIDKAIPPDKRAKPNRKIMVIVATLSGFLLSVLMAFIIEYKDRALEDPETRKKLEFIKSNLRF